MNRHRLCAAEDVPPEGIVRIAGVPGLARAVAIARSGGEFFCIDDACSHQEASLSDGWVADGCVECPLHESRFDLRTGKPDIPPACQPVATHPITVEDGVVYLIAEPA